MDCLPKKQYCPQVNFKKNNLIPPKILLYSQHLDSAQTDERLSFLTNSSPSEQRHHEKSRRLRTSCQVDSLGMAYAYLTSFEIGFKMYWCIAVQKGLRRLRIADQLEK